MPASSDSPLKNGLWKFELNLGEATLPFYCRYKNEDSSFTILNAAEKIICPKATYRNDSVFFSAPVFQNEFRLKIFSGMLVGYWHNTGRSKDYKIAVKAILTDEIPSIESTLVTPGQKWDITFGDSKENYKAIGLFNYFSPEINTDAVIQKPITGTFITETGDYRFLEGKQINQQFTLSCFDGSHAFLFKGEFNASNDSVKGVFYSGNHHKESFSGFKNDKVHLRNPDSITYIKPGYDGLAFSFPDLTGKKITFPSAEFQNKVVIVDLMGSWCPNCMDATLFLNKLYGKYKSKGLEIVGLCFERSEDYKTSVAAVSKMKNTLKAEFPFLIAGVASKSKASESLPMLNAVTSYPTTIIIDKKGKVRKIYTGIYGPSTGLYYTHYVEQTETFVEKLLSE